MQEKREEYIDDENTGFLKISAIWGKWILELQNTHGGRFDKYWLEEESFFYFRIQIICRKITLKESEFLILPENLRGSLENDLE